MALTSFPPDLPVPVDDGGAAHLYNTKLPSIDLPSTSGVKVNLASLTGLAVLFCYPRTGAPDEVVPDSWNSIPGARGCTPQACKFRDLFNEMKQAGVQHVFGISTQDTNYQREVHGRLHLPYDLLSDDELALQKGLNLPTIDWLGKTLIKRMALVCSGGTIVQVFYPVFPPDQNANDVLAWLRTEWKQRS